MFLNLCWREYNGVNWSLSANTARVIYYLIVFENESMYLLFGKGTDDFDD